MTLEQIYLCHHGIKGQKWGEKNGPPYPLDYSKLSDEERRNAKREAIRTGNIKEANANVYYFSNKDIQDVLDRFDMKRKVKSLAEKDIKTGKQKLEEFISYMGLVAKATDNGIRIYNNAAKISNSIAGTNMPLIYDKSRDEHNNNRGKVTQKDLLNTGNKIIDASNRRKQNNNNNRPKPNNNKPKPNNNRGK